MFIGLIVILFIFGGSWFAGRAEPAAANRMELGDATQNGTNFYSYLPKVLNMPDAQTLFGVEVSKLQTGNNFNLIRSADFYFVRRNGLLWSAVEPVKNGGYNWGNVASLEQELLLASQNGLRPILIVRSTPSWAQRFNGYFCGPMKDEYFDEFGAFLAAAVARYSSPPYNVDYFEIWNEPDVDPAISPPDQVFGCWGDNGDKYYGGRKYGQMLNVVAPMMRAANPKVKILIGGLLLDCDPRNPPPGENCKPSKFLEGILVSGAKNSFDGVSFHAYDFYNYWNANTFGNPRWNSGKLNSEPNGVMQPVMSTKIAFINGVLGNFGATGKFLINSEVALVCGPALASPGGTGCEAADNSTFEQMKKAYAAQAYAVGLYEKLRANIWFSMEGWRNSGLVYGNGTPRPAYYAIKFAEDMLWQAVPISKITNYPNVVGYKFFTPAANNLWIIWATDGTSKNITLPATPKAIRDSAGNSVTVTGTSVTLSIQPYYIEMP